VDNEVRTAFDKEKKRMKERGSKVLALVPLNLDGYLFDGGCTAATATQIKTRMAADFTRWEQDNSKFEQEFGKLLKALRSDDGGREKPPKQKL
jgi:hypothetical protein